MLIQIVCPMLLPYLWYNFIQKLSLHLLVVVITYPRFYFRPLKKRVVLPLAIVKRGRATP